MECENQERESKNLPPLYVIHDGACDPDCNCPETRSPVCGENRQKHSKSYLNYCYLECASEQSQEENKGSITWKHYNYCKDDKSCLCPFVDKPVCADNGKTFGSKCRLDCENAKRREQGSPALKVEHKGQCKTKCETKCVDQPPYPICGDDGEDYKNVCYLACASLKSVKEGKGPILADYLGRC